MKRRLLLLPAFSAILIGLAACASPAAPTSTVSDHGSDSPAVESQSPEAVESPESAPAPVAADCAASVGTFPEALGQVWSQNASFPLIGSDVMDGIFEAKIPGGGCVYAAPDGASYVVLYEGTGAWSRWDDLSDSIGANQSGGDGGPWTTTTPGGTLIVMNFYLLTTDNIEMGRSYYNWSGREFDQHPLIVQVVTN
jgi:hypothetical protein